MLDKILTLLSVPHLEVFAVLMVAAFLINVVSETTSKRNKYRHNELELLKNAAIRSIINILERYALHYSVVIIGNIICIYISDKVQLYIFLLGAELVALVQILYDVTRDTPLQAVFDTFTHLIKNMPKADRDLFRTDLDGKSENGDSQK